ncbi:MAG: hypothetical protein FVQ81_14405 [Candidatus Glassbacteria bacterium]|nr:hypothetical protein [Candidatus Glassbacteria bacterium]
MAEIKLTQPETLLDREQLREVERFQARFAELELQLHNCVDEFLSVLTRHYFNRENGYINEQQENLREIVTIQSKLEAMAANMATGAAELRKRMLELQKDLQQQGGAPAEPEKPEQAEEPAGETGKAEQEPEQKAKAEADKPEEKQASRAPVVDRLIVKGEARLADTTEAGGEISLKVIFDGLRLTDASNAEALNEISSALRKLLYDRKLVGYSKTSLVFGKNRTVGEVLEDLTPVFLSETVEELMVVSSLIEPGSAEKLGLACNVNRELVYIENQ